MARDDFKAFDYEYENPDQLLDMVNGGCAPNWDLVTIENIGDVISILEGQERIPKELPHRIAVILNQSNFRDLGLSGETLELLDGILGKAFSAGNLDRVLPVC